MSLNGFKNQRGNHTSVLSNTAKDMLQLNTRHGRQNRLECVRSWQGLCTWTLVYSIWKLKLNFLAVKVIQYAVNWNECFVIDPYENNFCPKAMARNTRNVQYFCLECVKENKCQWKKDRPYIIFESGFWQYKMWCVCDTLL